MRATCRRRRVGRAAATQPRISSGRRWARGAGPALWTRTLATVLVLAAAQGCALTEVVVTDSEDVVVAELVVLLEQSMAGDGISLEATALLHRTLGQGRDLRVPGAVMRITGESGAVVELRELDSHADCAYDPVVEEGGPQDLSLDDEAHWGTCYGSAVSPSPFLPGERLEAEVALPDGGMLAGAGRAPGAFDMVGLTHAGGTCRMTPDTNLRLEWTRADGAWGYGSGTRIDGLPEALLDRDLDAPDSLFLTGFNVGADDTELVFPSQYGLFDLGEGDQVSADLLRALDDGLPGGASAVVTINAVDRNWVNWARGGNFNPSGLIRVGSLTGAGTGVFGVVTKRTLMISAQQPGEGAPPLCGPAVN